MTRRIHACVTARVGGGGFAAACLVGVSCIASSASGAPVFKCLDAAGKISYQDKACATATTQTTVPIEPAPASPGRRVQTPASSTRTAATQPSSSEVAQMEADARGVRAAWQRMGQAINRGDTEAALRELTPSAQQRFRPVFDTTTKSSPPLKFEQLGAVQSVSVMGSTLATITLVRKQPDGMHAYEVMLMKAPDGRWLIDGM